MRTPRITVLLPPSEGKAPGGDGPGWSPDDGVFGSRLEASRRTIVDALAAIHGGDARLLGLRGPHLDRASSANASLLGAPTLPAWRRYTGVVWDHLDPASLAAAQRRRIVVVSGLLGLVRADDPTPDYRLRIGAALAPVGKLSRWWRQPLADALGAHTRGHVVVDLLTDEHRAAAGLRPRRTGPGWPAGASGVSVVLRERSGAAAGHAAKAAKGRLVRHLLTAGVHPSAALDTWRDDRFVLDVMPLGGH